MFKSGHRTLELTLHWLAFTSDNKHQQTCLALWNILTLVSSFQWPCADESSQRELLFKRLEQSYEIKLQILEIWSIGCMIASSHSSYQFDNVLWPSSFNYIGNKSTMASQTMYCIMALTLCIKELSYCRLTDATLLWHSNPQKFSVTLALAYCFVWTSTLLFGLWFRAL